MLVLPKLYAICDRSFFLRRAEFLDYVCQLNAAGCQLLQYRNKLGTAPDLLNEGIELRSRLGTSVTLILNDRADLALAAGFNGVHLGQDDLSPDSARKMIGNKRLLGVSTHNPRQVEEADKSSADYIAIGPVFATSSKANPDPVVGLDGVRQARGRPRKPLVAIGGITRSNALSVIRAGADCLAVISDLLPEPIKSAEEFLGMLG